MLITMLAMLPLSASFAHMRALARPASLHRPSALPPASRRTSSSSSSTSLRFSVDDIGVGLYDAQLTVSTFVETQLVSPSPISFVFLYAAGLLTAFSPCSISLVPLTLAYLGGNEVASDGNGSEKKNTLLTRSLSYAAGLATMLTLFGLSAAILGNVFGASGVLGDASGLLSSVIFLMMGLYLLEIVQFDFPSIETKLAEDGAMPASLQAYLLGATSALIASPCASPVLTSLLAVVAASGNASVGAVFLFAYSLGEATPVVIAGAASGFAARMWQSGGASWANPAFASLLISYGTFSVCDNVSKILHL
jgi:cytochrome c-type biogenesis protein